MGQGPSQPERLTEGDGRSRPHRRNTVLRRFRRRSQHSSPADESQQHGLLAERPPAPLVASRLRNRQSGSRRVSQLLNFDGATTLIDDEDAEEPSRASVMLQRTRSAVQDILSRREHSREGSRPAFTGHRSSYIRAGMNRDGADYYPPRLPSIELPSTSFGHDAFDPPIDVEPTLPSHSSSIRRPNLRLNSLRPDRPFRHFPTLRRRRHSPEMRRISGAEDQAAMLSRLLSVAAAATAATLMGDDPQALHEARSLTASTGAGDIGASGEDGSFDGFLRALQNGRIASALRSGGDMEPDAAGAPQNPLNFFRMFRFSSSTTASPGTGEADATTGASEAAVDGSEEGRMVPIIIVGIRSITPGSGTPGSGSAAEDLPPFIDALGSFPSALPNNVLGQQGQDSIDSILRPPQNGTSFRHRRRASLGNLGANLGMGRSRGNDRMDDQRDHRSPDRRRDRPLSIASSTSAFEPRPPPATPASPSPELSRISSRNTTPGHSRPASIAGTSSRDLGDSRRNSILHHRASTVSPLTSHTEETMSIHSTHSSTNLLSSETESFRFNGHRRSDTTPNIHHPRYSSGNSRRHGVVEPLGDLPTLSRSSTSNSNDNLRGGRRSSSNDSRSWIIYVLGGSYPENHPILTTPSLFTDNPTYEDMMLLSALLGPAKAPVATEEEVESAGGLYTLVLNEVHAQQSADAEKTAALVAVALEDADDRVSLEPRQRCLVCLCDFEPQELTRKLVKCQHLYHKECIDQWLTQGRNSCPLCRAQGVDEKEKADSSSASVTDEDVEHTNAGASDERHAIVTTEVEQAS